MREKGDLSFSGSLEVQKAGPLDARGLVQTFADLTNADTWLAHDGSSYAYKGMLVSVAEDPDSDKNGTYKLNGLPPTDVSNWGILSESTTLDGKLIASDEEWEAGTSVSKAPSVAQVYETTMMSDSSIEPVETEFPTVTEAGTMFVDPLAFEVGPTGNEGTVFNLSMGFDVLNKVNYTMGSAGDYIILGFDKPYNVPTLKIKNGDSLPAMSSYSIEVTHDKTNWVSVINNGVPSASSPETSWEIDLSSVTSPVYGVKLIDNNGGSVLDRVHAVLLTQPTITVKEQVATNLQDIKDINTTLESVALLATNEQFEEGTSTEASPSVAQIVGKLEEETTIDFTDIELPFTFPELTENGTDLDPYFVSSSSPYETTTPDTGDVFHVTKSTGNNYQTEENPTLPIIITFGTNEEGFELRNINVINKTESTDIFPIKGYEVRGSATGLEGSWVTLATGENTVDTSGGKWNIEVDNDTYYKQYALVVTSLHSTRMAAEYIGLEGVSLQDATFSVKDLAAQTYEDLQEVIDFNRDVPTLATNEEWAAGIVDDKSPSVEQVQTEFANYYNKSEIDTKVSGVYRIKGSLADYAALEAIADQIGGDVYNILDTGDNYVWVEPVGEGEDITPGFWDKLSGTIEAETYSNEEAALVSVGGIKEGTIFNEMSFTSFMEKAFYPELTPELVAPYVTFTIDKPGLIEVGAATPFNLTARFDQGSVVPAYKGGPSVRSGLPTRYIYTGSTLVSVDSTDSMNMQGIAAYKLDTPSSETLTCKVAYSEGEQPLTSKGNAYDTALVAGETAEATITIEAVYPYFATTSSVTEVTKQPLFKGEYFELTLVSEDDLGNKQTVEWAKLTGNALTGIEIFNTISNKWEWLYGSKVNSKNSFTETEITKTINGTEVTYYQYVHNTSKVGARQLRFYTS